MPKYLVYAYVFALMTIALPAAQANGIAIQSATSELLGDVYTINADIEFQLGAEVLEALVHGVELNIDIFIEVKHSRKWLWDPGVIESVLRYKLAYQPLTSLYVITNVINNKRSQFRSIDEATAVLGTIRRHMILNQASLERDRRYLGRLMAKLNIDDLPPPLQTTAHVAKQWRLQSPWYEWLIR